MHILYDLSIGGVQCFLEFPDNMPFVMRSILGPTLKNQGVVLRFHF